MCIGRERNDQATSKLRWSTFFGKGKMSKSEQYLRSPKKNFTTENFFGVSDAEFCADFSDTTHWAETGSKKKRTQKNCPKWPKMG